MKIFCGVYKIEDIETGNSYIGSASDIKKRWSNHSAKLRGGYYEYDELQQAWNNGEKQRVKFEILEECNFSDLEEREKFWVEYFTHVDGITIINKNTNNIKRRSKSKNTEKMSNAQRGIRNGNCKLSVDEIKKIKQLLAEGELKQYQIAEMFNVSQAQITKINRGLRWGHIA